MRVEADQQRIELTRRNLLSLLAKLDGYPFDSACALEMDGWTIKAVEDAEHYADRRPGVIDPSTHTELYPGYEQLRLF